MRKFVLFILFAVLSVGAVSAQEYSDESGNGIAPLRKKYRNLSFASQVITVGDDIYLQGAVSKYGGAFTTGRSYIVHKKPIARMLHIGIDATWFDATYGHWNRNVSIYNNDDNRWMHKVDIGMGVGVGVHLTPVRKLGVHTYVRYNPTVSILVHNFVGTEEAEVEIDMGYASYFTAGAAVSWGVISLGIESRFGEGKYSALNASKISLDEDDLRGLVDKKKHTLGGWRAYVGFRF